jgi:ornithine cyclodeaminase/alanine dehydrogenase-like protein (mu-crystallin family)
VAYASVGYQEDLGGLGAILGTVWVTEFPANRELGAQSLNSLIVLDDPEGLRSTIALEGNGILCARAAAVTGVCIRQFAPPVRSRSSVTALIGAGALAAAHVAPLGALEPGVEVVVWDPHPERAQELVHVANEVSSIGSVRAVASAQEAVAHANVVITTTSLTQRDAQIGRDWLAPEALVVTVSGDCSVAPDVAESATLCLTDDVELYEAARSRGRFAGYPPVTRSIGNALDDEVRWRGGIVLVIQVGASLIDLVLAATIRDRLDQGLDS